MERASFGVTDVGLIRDRNEDCVLFDDELGLYAVADGVGGHAAGDRASKMALQGLMDVAAELRELADQADQQGGEASRRAVFDALQAVTERANQDIYAAAQGDEDLRGMMTTLTVVLLAANAAYIAHVGDSRAYLLRDRALDLLTVDHTLAEELVRAGRLTRQEVATFTFRNVLARAIGEKAQVDVDLLFFDLLADDRLLLCSDGLTDFVDANDVLAHLMDTRAANPAQALIDTANDHGGGDNVSAVVIDLSMTVEESRTDITAIRPMDHTSKISVLSALFFLRHLTDEELMKVLRYVHEVHCQQGEVVVQQGEDGQDLFLVVEGVLSVLVDGVRVNTLKEGAHFGEIALVSGQRRSAQVQAETDVRLFQMSRAGFYDLTQKDQRVAIKMLWAFSQTLGKRVTLLSHDLATARKAR